MEGRRTCSPGVLSGWQEPLAAPAERPLSAALRLPLLRLLPTALPARAQPTLWIRNMDCSASSAQRRCRPKLGSKPGLSSTGPAELRAERHITVGYEVDHEVAHGQRPEAGSAQRRPEARHRCMEGFWQKRASMTLIYPARDGELRLQPAGRPAAPARSAAPRRSPCPGSPGTAAPPHSGPPASPRPGLCLRPTRHRRREHPPACSSRPELRQMPAASTLRHQVQPDNKRACSLWQRVVPR